MINKKVAIFILVVFTTITAVGYGVIRYLESSKAEGDIFRATIEGEYTPVEEITESQLRQTIVNVSFLEEESGELKNEGRLVDVKELYFDPYNKLVSLLIDGPNNNELTKLIPDNTKLNGTILEGECVIIDFNEEFLNYNNEEGIKGLLLDSIITTLSQLTEVNSIKILIDGKNNEEFSDVYTLN